MLIAIPSTKRSTRQITLKNLPPKIRSRVKVIVPHEELGPYSHIGPGLWGTLARGIGPTRQHIMDMAISTGENKVLMLDDDLTFAIRRLDDKTKFETPIDYHIETCINEIDVMLDSYAHVAISPREGGNRRTEVYVHNNRALRALAFRADVLLEEGVRFDRAELMEDFYVQLSLLTKGYQHLSINWMVQNQAGSNLAGGCSTYRTMERQSAAARYLASKFPDFVKVVKKQTKTAWGGQDREDVVIQWKKAYEYGAQRKGVLVTSLDKGAGSDSSQEGFRSPTSMD